MRFYLGQVLKNVYLEQEAIVTAIQDEGRMALLRFVAGNGEEWVCVDEIGTTTEWRLEAQSNDNCS